jgi:hypothetical protein
MSEECGMRNEEGETVMGSASAISHFAFRIHNFRQEEPA